jgi:hypothetical protein
VVLEDETPVHEALCEMSVTEKPFGFIKNTDVFQTGTLRFIKLILLTKSNPQPLYESVHCAPADSMASSREASGSQPAKRLHAAENRKGWTLQRAHPGSVRAGAE